MTEERRYTLRRPPSSMFSDASNRRNTAGTKKIDETRKGRCSFVYGVTNFLLQFFWNPFSLVFAPSFLFCILNIIEERRIAWPWEYKADARASSKVGTETMISALKKTLSPEFESCDTPTHPSLKRRIDHLRKIENKAKEN